MLWQNLKMIIKKIVQCGGSGTTHGDYGGCSPPHIWRYAIIIACNLVSMGSASYIRCSQGTPWHYCDREQHVQCRRNLLSCLHTVIPAPSFLVWRFSSYLIVSDRLSPDRTNNSCTQAPPPKARFWWEGPGYNDEIDVMASRRDDVRTYRSTWH